MSKVSWVLPELKSDLLFLYHSRQRAKIFPVKRALCNNNNVVQFHVELMIILKEDAAIKTIFVIYA